MHRTVPKRVGFALAAGLGIFAISPLGAQSDGLAMLGGLAKGQWTVKFRDGSADAQMCVRSGEELIQIKHQRTGCSRFVVEDSASKVTVQYTCPGDGYGRTNIRRETGTLVQIDGQGIASGVPFQFAAEARRTGSC